MLTIARNAFTALQYGGISVEVQCSEEATVITLEQYEVGMAPVMLINTLEEEPVYYHQKWDALTIFIYKK